MGMQGFALSGMMDWTDGWTLDRSLDRPSLP
jgi:hypothetical protein